MLVTFRKQHTALENYDDEERMTTMNKDKIAIPDILSKI